MRWRVVRMTNADAHGQEGTATASQPLARTPLSTRLYGWLVFEIAFRLVPSKLSEEPRKSRGFG